MGEYYKDTVEASNNGNGWKWEKKEKQWWWKWRNLKGLKCLLPWLRIYELSSFSYFLINITHIFTILVLRLGGIVHSLFYMIHLSYLRWRLTTDNDIYKYIKRRKNNRLGGAATGTILKNKLSIFCSNFFHPFYQAHYHH